MRRTRLSAQGTIALGFAAWILLIALLLMLPLSSAAHTWTDPLTALFTSTSAVCVTGLVVVDTAAHWSAFGQLIILLAIQAGGLGVMTVLALLPMMLNKRIGLRERALLFESVSSLHIGGVVRLVRRALLITLFIEGAGALLLSLRFVPEAGLLRGAWLSVFHAVSAFCNAGFDITGLYAPYASLEPFAGDPLVCLTVCLLILLGGLGFFVFDDLIACRLRVRRMQLHTRAVLLMTPPLVLLPACLFFFSEHGASMAGMSVPIRMLQSVFCAVTPRTAGFSAVPTDTLSPAGKLLTLLLMAIGGNPGSTAGGAKTTTMLLLLLIARSFLRQQQDALLLDRRLPPDLLRRACSIVIVYFVLAFAAALAVCALQPALDPFDALFEVVSALNTVGMSTGVTRSLNAASQLIIILLMYAGRLGSLTFALLIARSPAPPPVRRPQERLLVG